MFVTLATAAAHVALADGPAPAATQPAASSHATMAGRLFAGYQGWFATRDDAGKDVWRHYGRGGKFEPGWTTIDLWPDVSELDPDERVATPFRHADGRVAQVFSSADPRTVDRHFAWMREYGIDGVFLQRFGADLRSAANHMSRVLSNVRASADRHDRSWAVMYDLSGLREGQIAERVIEDWKSLVRGEKAGDVRRDRTYLHHRGKPVVAVWGIGFSDGRRYSLDECRALVRFLKSDPQFGGNTVVLGVPYWWRGLHRDALADPLLHEIIAEADVISPWSVGRLRKPEEAASRQTAVLEPDKKWLDERGLDYLPVVFPGFSFHNATAGKRPLDEIPRRGGALLWAQAVAAKRAGADAAYVAMFDELDEGTAVFKTTSDVPIGASVFLVEPNVPPDHYLWLSGEIGRLMRGEIHPSGDGSDVPRRDKR